MVPSSFDPFLPTAEELAGDGPALRDNDDKPSGRQASITHARLAPPAQHHTQKIPLASPAQATKPLNPTQEDEPGKEPAVDYKEALGPRDQTQHFLLVFTQVTNGQPYVRIDTSKANWEGELPHKTTCTVH